MRQLGFCVLLFSFLAGCASAGDSSSGYLMPEMDEGSQADPNAFAADSFTFRKDMPDRRDWKPWEFYYKHCSINGREAFYSKTSYDCTGPYSF
jgi:hypothetical protein